MVDWSIGKAIKATAKPMGIHGTRAAEPQESREQNRNHRATGMLT